MKKLLTLLLFIPVALLGQNYCDVELIDFDWVDETVTFAVLADSCYTANDDFDPNNPSIITAQVYLWDPFTNLGILAPCWGIPLQGSGINTWPPAVVGDTLTIPFASFQTCELADEIANGNVCNFTATLSVNGSPSSGDDFPNNNSLTFYNVCPCDSTIEYVYDTIYDTIVLVETDTITEIEYIYLTDTMYVETVVYEYIYVYNTDTITEFVAESIYIDCETGEVCEQIFPCDETSIFAPNAVTPNGDNWNDTWMVIADGACWSQWETRIYNRWGGLVWISASNLDEWNADVPTGTYVYTITAHSSMNASVFQFNGTITVLY